jgi:thioredoxin reductase
VIAAERTQDGFEVVTGDGAYRTAVLVLATGMATPWRPSFPGVELAADYADLEAPATAGSAGSRVERYRVARFGGRRVLVVGKQNSGFEVATQLLPVAAQVIVVGPGPTRFTVTTHSFAGARARFDQPFEDHVVGGGTSVLDAAIVSVRRTAGGLEVEMRMSADDSLFAVEVDDVITATGFTTDFGPFTGLGLDRFARGTLPRQSPYWESTSTPGVYFAGTLGQGARGLRRYGVPGTSASIQGFRYNAVVQTRHLARTRFGLVGRRIPVDDPVEFLQHALVSSPELMSQKGYLARVVAFGGDGSSDAGLEPLAAFVDGSGDAVAATIEAGPDGEIHPAIHVRTAAGVTEHLLEPHPLHRFDGPGYRRQVAAAVEPSRLRGAGRTATAAT